MKTKNKLKPKFKNLTGKVGNKVWYLQGQAFATAKTLLKCPVENTKSSDTLSVAKAAPPLREQPLLYFVHNVECKTNH